MPPLRIITINTGKCDGKYEKRIDWLATELKKLQPDVIACQEVFRDEAGRFDTPSVLADRLAMQLHWTPARFKPRVCEGETVSGWSGMAVLSRTPFAMAEWLELPVDELDGERVAQFVLLEVEDTPVVLANIHLTHLPDGDPLRAQQLRRVLSHPLMGMKRALRLVCGDFNTTADGPVLAPLLEQCQFGDLADAYVLGGGGSNRATLQSGRCVDHILSLAEEAVAHPAFKSSAVVLDRASAEGVLPSDHFGVATTMLTLPVSNWLDRRRAALVE